MDGNGGVLLELLAPDRVQAYGIAATSILTAWVARQSSKVKKLQARLDELEEQSEADRRLFKRAVRFIRDVLARNAMLVALLQLHAPNIPLPDPVEIPDELKEEV